MKKISLFVMLISVAFFACSRKKVEKTTATKIEKEAPVDKPVVTQTTTQTTSKGSNTEAVDANLVAKIKRTPCYGKCPVFTIELFSNGLVTSARA